MWPDNGPPPPRGTTFAGDYDSSQVAFTSLGTWGVPGQLLLNSSAMSLTRDGQFRLGSQQYAKNNLEATTTGSTIAGRCLRL